MKIIYKHQMKKTKQKKNKISGFSLVEMVIVVAISAIIAMAASQTFLAGMKTSERNKEMQKNLEEARSTMEIMAKNIRMSQYLKTFNTEKGLTMYNSSQGKCMKYRVNDTDDALMYAECVPDRVEGKVKGADEADGNNPPCSGTVSCAYPDGYTPLTTGSATTGGFIAVRTAATDKRATDEQVIGKATIRITVGTGTDLEETLQTTVSFRDYDGILQ